LSHSKERHEKICLNCNSELIGRYCHQCGQENIEPKETVWGLVSHFFYDITHFDGKFFGTTRQLIAKPGFLPKEYIAGRRARYLHPIRMYVFSSAVFFLVFFSLFHVKHVNGIDKIRDLTNIDTLAARLDSAEAASMKKAITREDSITTARHFQEAKKATATGNYRYHANDSTNKNTDTTTARVDTNITEHEAGNGSVDKLEETLGKKAKYRISVNGVDVKTVKQYDSLQATLPPGKRDSWLERRIAVRNIELRERYKDDEMFAKDLLNKFTHTFPYLLFLSLPLYALFLKLLYIRHKQYYYTDHGIFLIYLYIFTFIVMLIYFSLDKLEKSLNWGWVIALEVLLFGYGVWYAYKAMRKFYQQGRSKTMLKFIGLNFLAVISLIFLFLLFFVISVFQL
jgi:hypothetical protein